MRQIGNSSLAKEAYEEILSDSDRFDFLIEYSGRLKDFNARVRKNTYQILVILSDRWIGIDDDIQKGLIQELLCKLFHVKRDTDKMELYRLFVKNMHFSAIRTENDETLKESFIRVNEKYFNGKIDEPNLKFGKESRRTLGTYNYHTDTITVTSLFRKAENELIDYVIYHELLHKKIKFDHHAQKRRHHTTEFRSKEKEFDNFLEIEKKIQVHLNRIC